MRTWLLSLLAVFGGCGRLGFDPAGNGEPLDTDIDADGNGIPDVLDGPPGDLRLRVMRGLVPYQGKVALHDPDGELIEIVMSDVDGRIDRIVSPGSIATAGSLSYVVIPGDVELQLGWLSGTDLGQMTIDVPTFAGASG